MRPDFSEFYVNLKNEPEKHWPRWSPQSLPSVSDSHIHSEFTPLLHNRQTEEENRRLHWIFIQFNAETQIVLEQLFIYALRRQLPNEIDPIWKRACRKLMLEEYLHANAYRRFLTSEPHSLWPRWSTTLRGHKWTKRFLCHLLRLDPVCMVIPAAKFETYSLFYSNYLVQICTDKNRWSELNRMHKLDEVHHVSFDYAWYDTKVRGRSFLYRIQTVVLATLFFLGLQVLLASSCLKIMRKLYPDRGFLTQTRLAMKFAQWGVRKFPPYVETRKNLKESFLRHKFIHHRILSFMYW